MRLLIFSLKFLDIVSLLKQRVKHENAHVRKVVLEKLKCVY